MKNNYKNSPYSLYERQVARFKYRLKEAIGDESVRSFSRRCKISESVIRKYLNGSHPVMDKLPRIAEASGRSMVWLLTGNVEYNHILNSISERYDEPNTIDNELCREKSSLADRLKLLMKDRSIEQVANDWGINAATVTAYITCDTVPNLDLAYFIAQKEGVTLQWLATGQNGINIGNFDQNDNKCDYRNTYTLIPSYCVKASESDKGTLPCSDNVEPIGCYWLKKRGFDQQDLAIVCAEGDSMEPTIHNNDVLVVHLRRNKPKDGYLYAFRKGDELFVKRYQSALNTWRLISDNPIYKMLDIPKKEQHQLQVIGQIVHIAKDAGD